ncbi:AraC family transcriptional regulator [Clostridium sp. SYSU_GA19001]|uniref:AraC family transcriptional regulator n=1 Tax=Clostridium caldaquaticum TaxID=2940653 RepID=UPI002076FA28|nr:AraC family transcriptional regulator [Clostridium caldaquaticum]MCM8710050.1 AraC family transcriptional regulator [Clostridium caldaquaticum]
MNNIHEDINPSLYTICALINNLTKLDVEFISCNEKSSFQILNSKMLYFMQSVKKENITFIHKFLQNKLSTDCLYHTDNLGLNYIASGLFECGIYKGTIIAGPFLSNIPDTYFISNIIEKNRFPLSYKMQLQEYYNRLNILDINYCKNIGHMMINILKNPFVDCNLLFSNNKNFDINEDNNLSMEIEKTFSEIEIRYKIEKALLKAVEKGDKVDALKQANFFQFNPVHRVPNDPLRAIKNYTYSFNTMLRIAAEKGGVSPIYVHNLSDKFAILIERLSTISEIENFKIKMICEYCDLVKKMSTAGFSPVIKKAVNYINLNFHKPISLNIIAENIHVNPSHLSRQFKKETKMTITEFINRKRIDEAKFILEKNDTKITDIALMVGFENHNYFCTVFKQVTSLTPREYVNKIGNKK